MPLSPPNTPVANVLRDLGVEPGMGLAGAEAATRLASHGPNVLPRPRQPSAVGILLRQMKDVMVLVLVAAIALSVFLGHRIEAAAIGAITLFTILLGFFQELRAARAMDALHRLTAPKATVVRDGQVLDVRTEDVVPGDIILLEQGDVVAADARLVEAVDLQVTEASLTGESDAVAKTADARMAPDQPVAERHGLVHATTIVTFGRARAVAVATGMDTELGRIGQLLAGVKPEPTPLQRQLARLARTLLWSGAAAVILVVLLGVLRGEPLPEMLLFGMAVAVAIVPEALPAVVTISLAVGAQRMAKRHALVRRLPTVETLGCTTVICSDKTGTLTRGQMAVTEVAAPEATVRVAADGYDPTKPVVAPGLSELMRACALCTDSQLRQVGGVWAIQGDPTEGALLVLAAKAGTDLQEAQTRWPRVAELTFSSERKRMTTLHHVDGVLTAYSKGAPETILATCERELTSSGTQAVDAERWKTVADAMAGRGLRVLAIARSRPKSRDDAETAMELLALVGMRDAPRPEAKSAIATCRNAGIRPVMITGDHPRTARAVAVELGILEDGETATGQDIEAWSDDEMRRRVERVNVYARVSPAQKLRIVSALQANGHVAAMTGDGVNDAPALRKADIGIAMGITGTDVSKEAAGMMLADDNFATIVAAVEEGRAIFDNIRKYLTFLLSTNFGEILLFAATLLLGLPLPLTAVQILYVNLASDGLPALALAVDPHEDDLMRRRPRKAGSAILQPGSVALMAFAAVVSAGANLAVFAWARAAGKPAAEATAMVFVSLVLIQLAKAYVFRAENRSILVRPFTNQWLNLAVLWEIALLGLIIYVPPIAAIFGVSPLSWEDWGVILGATAAVAVILETTKLAIRRRRAGNKTAVGSVPA